MSQQFSSRYKMNTVTKDLQANEQAVFSLKATYT